MTDTSASLSRQMHSARDLQSVVRTMKALAAASIGQYEESVRALGDYYRAVQLGLGVCLRHKSRQTRNSAPFSLKGGAADGARSGQRIGAVVFGSDQGLVGRFNDVIATYARSTLAALSGEVHVWAVGERVHGCLLDAGVAVRGLFPVPGSVQAIAPLIGQILMQQERLNPPGASGSAQLHLFYNHPGSALQRTGTVYAPVTKRLLPLDAGWRKDLADNPWPTRVLPELVGGDPAADQTLRGLIREYLFVSLFRACAESLASENASRLAAMERADRNIGDLLKTMHSRFHQLRQSGIDEELFDVISGFNALGSNRNPR